jgi:opacity protein-like surface antigen
MTTSRNKETGMLRRIVWSAGLVVLAAAAVQAQEKRGEFGLDIGYTGSNGINSNDVSPSGAAAVFVEAKPKSSFFWGLELGYFASEKFQIGALYAAQKSDLQLAGPNSWTNVGEGLDVQNMMGTFAFHTGGFDSKTRLYILGGLGATRYGNVTIVGPNGDTIQIGGKSKFATTWGLGVKMYPNPKVGFKLGFRWTPTNLGETADEWVCVYPTCEVTGTPSTHSSSSSPEV